MSKTQRRNNQAGVTHVADLLTTGRALSPRERVRCDLPPVAQNPVDAAKLAFDRKMAAALGNLGVQVQPGEDPLDALALRGNLSAVTQALEDADLADLLRHGSDSEGDHAN